MEGNFLKKLSHKFYAQIQGQLAMFEIKKCLFVVMHSKDIKQHFWEVIDFNVEYWERGYPKLKEFYFDYYRKVLL